MESLYDSHFCRLCGEQNSNGYPLFCRENGNEDYSIFINEYLPIKVSTNVILYLETVEIIF